MSDTEPQATDVATPTHVSPWIVPSPGPLWIMRLLAIAAFLVASFLFGIEVMWAIARERSAVPFCSAIAGFDCEVVLSNAQWSKWLGIPVSLPAVLLYAAVVWALFSLTPRRSPAGLRRIWMFLSFAVPAIVLSAVWFIYIQYGVLNERCLWCLIEHTLGLLLSILLLLFGLGLIRGWPVLGGVIAVVLLVCGQLFIEPSEFQAIPVAGRVDEHGRYAEEGSPQQMVSMLNGAVMLNRTQHPVLGNSEARYMLVEVVDYTCPRCRRASNILEKALAILGPEFGAMVVTFPLDGRCNRLIEETEPRHVHACVYAKLAHAVAIADPAAFQPFHAWLFANQEELTPEMATDEAARRITRGRLMELVGDPRLESVLRRDVDIAHRLDARALPGMYLANRMFPDIPDDPEQFAENLRRTAESIQRELQE